MIKFVGDKDIFDSKAEALVNPVNCKGVMGRGIALEFKKRYPEYFPFYQRACLEGKLRPGDLLFQNMELKPSIFGTKAVICFATKDDWKSPSKIEWIDEGLGFLKENYHAWQITSVAMPPLGCGLGGLKWSDVKELITKHFTSEPLDIEVYTRAMSDYGERRTKQISDYIEKSK